MRGYRNAERYAQQALAASTAAIQVRTVSAEAAATDAIDAAVGDVTGGATQTIADLKQRLDDAGIP